MNKKRFDPDPPSWSEAQMGVLKARVAELEAELAEQRRETGCWRATARDKGESSRNAAAERDRYRTALQSICDLDEVDSFSDTFLIASKALNP